MKTTHDPQLYLFVDDENIYQTYGTTRLVNRAARHPDPVITSSWKPDRMAAAWGSVIQEPDGRLRMWYLDMETDSHEKHKKGIACADIDHTFMCYAESTDGIRWDEPELGLVEWQGSKANNIVMNGALGVKSTDGGVTNFDGFTVVRDDVEPNSEERYKMIAHWGSVHLYDRSIHGKDISDEQLAKHEAAYGKYLATSPDGIRWDSPLVKIKTSYGDRILVSRDERNGRWWMSDRPINLTAPTIGFVRAAGLSYSDDLLNWSMPNELILSPDAEDGQGAITQIHTFFPFNYGSQDLGYLSVASFRGGGTQTYLLSHHDGQSWQRVFRDKPILERGTPGSFDRVMVVPLHNAPIMIGDEMFIYYTAAAGPNHPAGTRSIGVARLRQDAFVGIAAGGLMQTLDNRLAGEAFLLTKPSRVSGDVLQLNIEMLSPDARARVALLNPDLSPIAGFTLEECDDIWRDGLRIPVQWKDGASLKLLQDRKVMLHISFANSVIYAYCFGDSIERKT